MLWNKRAWRRFTKSVLDKGEIFAINQWHEDVKFNAALDVVIKWCKDRSLQVVFKRMPSMIFYDDKKIIINARSRPKTQLHILLHELGHYFVNRCQPKHRFKHGYPMISESNVKRTLRHRFDVLDEEFEAWHRGWMLALRLGILNEDDKKSYDRTRSGMLKSYALWAIKAPGYEYSNDSDSDSNSSLFHIHWRRGKQKC